MNEDRQIGSGKIRHVMMTLVITGTAKSHFPVAADNSLWQALLLNRRLRLYQSQVAMQHHSTLYRFIMIKDGKV